MVDRIRIHGTSVEASAGADGQPLAGLRLGLGALTLGSGPGFAARTRLGGVAAPEAPDDAVPFDLFDRALPIPPGLVADDPTVDSAPVIQAAIDDAAGGGWCVYLPPGEYFLTTPLVLRDNGGRIKAGLYGPSGHGAVLSWHPDAPARTDLVMLTVELEGGVCAHLWFKNGAVDLVGDRATVRHCGFGAVQTPASPPPAFGAVRCRGNLQTVVDCDVWGADGWLAVVLESGRGHAVLRNRLRLGRQDGIGTLHNGPGVTGCVIAGNVLEHCGRAGDLYTRYILLAGPAAGVTVTGNVVLDDASTASSGVYVGPAAADVVVTGNVVDGARWGVDVEPGAAGVQVVANRFRGCVDGDVRLAAGVAGAVVGPADPALRVEDPNPPLANRGFGPLTWCATRTARTALPVTGDGSLVQVRFQRVAGASGAADWDATLCDFVVPRAGVYLVHAAVQATREGGATGADELNVYVAHTDAAADPPVAEVHSNTVVTKAPADGVYACLTQSLPCARGAVLRVLCSVGGSATVNFCIDAERTRCMITYLG